MKELFNKGFTLIELMIVVAVIAILASIAFPSYQEYILRAKRGDGKVALLSAVLAQEKYRANHITYASDLADLGLDGTSPDGNYTIAITAGSATATTFTITATPSGFADAICDVLSIAQSNAGITKSASGTGDYDTCFSR